MANPSIHGSTNSLLVSKAFELTNNSTVTIIPAVSTNHVYQVDIFQLNNTSANTVTPVLNWLDSSETITLSVTGSVSLQTGSDLVVNLPVLNEGDLLTGTCNYANGIKGFISYKDIS